LFDGVNNVFFSKINEHAYYTFPESTSEQKNMKNYASFPLIVLGELDGNNKLGLGNN
jgi:hypothetical protein